jgi:alpha,alpha-trehalase
VTCSIPKRFVLLADRFDAVIFDLDGVITDTAEVHAKAWKEMFDAFLKARSENQDVSLHPFDKKEDYLRHVDGKPRYDGVSDFLASRGIELPYGSPEDPAEKDSVCGLGNRKNRLFQKMLQEDGAKVYGSSIRLVRRLRSAGVKTAIVSSSKNCATVLETAGITDLFDAKVDGIDAAERKLAGKPAPDIFIEAVRQLHVRPERAAVVEDALSGVAAGKQGHFACVIGVDRADQRKALEAHGADVVVGDLGFIQIDDRSKSKAAAKLVPSALDRVDEILGRLSGRNFGIFLDYDGTLTPIVRRPEDADLADAMRRILRKLTDYAPVAIVSGRDLKDVRDRVGLDGIFYAGSHGFDISGPDGLQRQHPQGVDRLGEIESAATELKKRLQEIDGCRIEHKKFALAVHYREVDKGKVQDVEDIVKAVYRETSGLRLSGGKKIFELQPDVDWNKGRAVRWLVENVLERDCSALMPLYIGDDVTDEDAFRELRSDGIGILVADDIDGETSARYRLRDPNEVQQFLNRLAENYEEEMDLRDWRLVYDGYDPQSESLREALCTLGNGYFATRGAGSESQADEIHYPGTYLAGGYNRLKTEKAGRIIENEDLVNMPNWLPLNFRFDHGKWFDLTRVKLLDYCQELNIRQGLLLRRLRFEDHRNRVTRVTERRFVHMSRAHLAGLEITLIPENWSGRIEFRSELDGRVINDGVARYRDLNNSHLVPLETDQPADDIVFLKVETSQSELRAALAARTRAYKSGEEVADERRTMQETGWVTQVFGVDVEINEPVVVEKIVSLYTSRDPAISECGLEARNELSLVTTFPDLFNEHRVAWEHLWNRFAIQLDGEDDDHGNRIGMIVHLYIFHLLQCTSKNTMDMDLDVGVPSRGWHGEAYRGHIFWDELFIFPMINLRLPEITRELLMYRYRRLDKAREAARNAGFRGAMYPWQSGSNGREESQEVHLNPKSGRWIPDNSHLQRHVNAAIAYNLYHYYQVTQDTEFLSFYGCRMMLEIARFLASLSRYNPDLERYEICGVMGPDEYHDAYPDSERPGLDNNSYTNIMTVWVLDRARELLDLLPGDVRSEIRGKLALETDELRLWEDISRRMRVIFHGDGIISQFEGYDDLEEFDWAGYREKYGDIQRLDRILEAEGDTPNRYKASKQADVLMLFYLLSAEEVGEIFDQLGYPFEYETIPKNIDYYLKRTCHGSTLSRVVHSWVLSRSDRARSWKLFTEALQSDVSDIQGGTTPEGIHLGAMAGTVDQLQRGYTGIVTRGDVLWFNPCLPERLKRLKLKIRYRSHFLDVEVTQKILRVSAIRASEKPIKIGICGEIYELPAGSGREFSLNKSG